MEGYNRTLKRLGPSRGISKISVQTGTSHGGVVLPDGSIAKVQLDLDALQALSRDARSEEHTSELQSPCNLVCRLLLEKKKKPRKATARLPRPQKVIESHPWP